MENKFPEFIKGKVTGWIYKLILSSTPEAAIYETVQFNGTYTVIFCLNNFKDKVIEPFN